MARVTVDHVTAAAANVTRSKSTAQPMQQGNVVFTDKPPAASTSAEQVTLPETNTTPATPVRTTTRRGCRSAGARG